MAAALILSSFVSATRIGGAAQQHVLAASGLEPVLAPTALFGRSPAAGGLGHPTPPEAFARMLADIETAPAMGRMRLVITGHFSLPEQVEAAAELLARLRAAGGARPILLVDPIMGDAPKGLYVKPAVAELVAAQLVPLADWITPNAWELGRLSGLEVVDATTAAQARQALGVNALATSIPVGSGEIGLLLCEGAETALFAHRRRDHVPNGTGDLATASFGAGLAQGMTPLAAAERAACAAAEAAEAAVGLDELPMAALAPRPGDPPRPVQVRRIAG